MEAYVAGFRATPVFWAAAATSRATALTTERSKTLGMMNSSLSMFSGTPSVMALAAASFISSLMSRARTSSTPRNRPGKQRLLLTWLG